MYEQWVSASISVSYAFACVFSRLIVLFYYSEFIFVLSLFYFYFNNYPFEACFLSNERQKGDGSGWEENW